MIRNEEKWKIAVDPINDVDVGRECHQNRTLYQMLKLDRVLDVSSLGEQARKMNIESEVRRLTSTIRFDKQLTLLTQDAKEQLRDFAQSELLRVNFTAYSILVSSIDAPNNIKKTLNPHTAAF